MRHEPLVSASLTILANTTLKELPNLLLNKVRVLIVICDPRNVELHNLSSSTRPIVFAQLAGVNFRNNTILTPFEVEGIDGLRIDQLSKIGDPEARPWVFRLRKG